MSRARGRSAGGQNADSLLDTMANVVGILVVVMAVTQVTVGDAMERIRSFESEEAVALRAAEREARARLADADPVDLERTLELARLRAHLAELPKQAAARRDADPQTLAAELARDRLRVRRLERERGEREQEVARLKLLLEESLARTRADAVEVRLPDPRPAPPAAEEMKIFCRYGRVFDPRFDRLERELVEVLRTATPPATRYFDQHDVGNELVRWRLLEELGKPVARLEWRNESVGETVADLQSPDARFRREVLEREDPSSRFLRFYVWADSFAVYLEARRLAEQAGFPAGWEAFPDGRPLDLVRGGPRRPTPVD